jgi:predicted dehydrogenase
MWDVSLALKMTLRTDYYADAERFEIQGEEGIIQVTRCSDRMLDEPALTLYRDGEVRAFHNLDADWGGSFTLSTRHLLDVLAGREPEEALTAQEGRRVIALYDLFQRSNAERRAVADSGGSDRRLRSLQNLLRPAWAPGSTSTLGSILKTTSARAISP